MIIINRDVSLMCHNFIKCIVLAGKPTCASCTFGAISLFNERKVIIMYQELIGPNLFLIRVYSWVFSTRMVSAIIVEVESFLILMWLVNQHWVIMFSLAVKHKNVHDPFWLDSKRILNWHNCVNTGANCHTPSLTINNNTNPTVC